jgi:CxxC motif-containing protein
MINLSDKDILTSIVRVKGSLVYDVMPVKSSGPIEKSLWIECSKALGRIHVGPPMNIGDIVCKNILNTGVDIVCTKNIPRDEK